MSKSNPLQGQVPYKITTMESWLDFIRIIEGQSYSGWAFRGQEDSTWEVNSTLARYLKTYVNPKYWDAQEQRNLRIFKRKAHQFLEHIPSYSDTFQWLALMQHHGAPTRLLDFTWSPYVAAFFALERAQKTASVWALNPKKTENITERYDYYIQSKNSDPIGIGEPFVMNKRLIAQSGTLVVTKTLDKPIEEIVSTYDDPADVLARLDFPKHARDEGMRALFMMNITNATLFPGLDGLARSLAYELEFHWAHDPRKKTGEVGKDKQ